MKSYDDFRHMYEDEDELYDYVELVGEGWARLEFLSALLKKQNREEMEKLVKTYQWGE